jgi:hypothetical protein
VIQTTFRPDILLTGPDGTVLAQVEVHNPPDLSPDAAAEIRRCLLTAASGHPSTFLLVVSQDRGYLWTNGGAADRPPDFEFPMAEVVKRYWSDAAPGRLRGQELEFIVHDWLNSLARGSQGTGQEPEATLECAGFLKHTRGAWARWARMEPPW